MLAADFRTEAFRNGTEPMKANIGEIVSRYTKDHLLHYHATLHDGNTALGEWARKRILENGLAVLYGDLGEPLNLDSIDREPNYELPDGQVYHFDGKSLIIRLDRLPFTYSHQGARNGGQLQSPEFEADYLKIKSELGAIAKSWAASGVSSRIFNFPDAMTGAGIELSAYGDSLWRKIIEYAMKQQGTWHPSFDEITFSNRDHCVEGYPEGFDYNLMVRMINTFGGWIDIRPGIRETPKPDSNVVCNFTTCGQNERGLVAIIQGASVSNPQALSANQIEFIDAVFDAFH